MDTADLKIFLALCETRSFSLAAEKIHLTQPAVSKRIANLERELGARLFDRISRQVFLTESGKLLESRARQLINDLDNTASAIQSLRGSLTGTLSLGISHHLGLHRFPNVLKAFSERYPSVSLDVEFLDSERAYTLVQQGSIELAAITLAPTLKANISNTRLWRDRLCFVCANNHPIAKLANPNISDLAQYSCLLPAENTYTGQIIRGCFDNAALTLLPIVTANYMETLGKMTEIGLGWAVLPEILVTDAMKVLEIPVPLSRELGLITHKERTPSYAAQLFVELAKEMALGSQSST